MRKHTVTLLLALAMSLSLSASPAASHDVLAAPEKQEQSTETDTRTEDEKLIDDIVEACSAKATAETDYEACVVDVRTARNPYEIRWNYGTKYSQVSKCWAEEWDLVFDAEYYKKTFPMLAMQHHYDDNYLKWHFTTVGIHEGRQGCESFNVKAYMDACPAKIKKAFGDNYACYYLYYMFSENADRTQAFPGKGCPKQMAAVLTIIQKDEIRRINEERKRLGKEPLTFDSELAAIANYRAWINASQGYAAHDWAKQNNDALWDMVDTLHGDKISENTITRFNISYEKWYTGYRLSEPHYKAMTNDKYAFNGGSNVYIGNNDVDESRDSDVKLIHFDIFMDDLDTALNSK